MLKRLRFFRRLCIIIFTLIGLLYGSVSVAIPWYLAPPVYYGVQSNDKVPRQPSLYVYLNITDLPLSPLVISVDAGLVHCVTLQEPEYRTLVVTDPTDTLLSATRFYGVLTSDDGENCVPLSLLVDYWLISEPIYPGRVGYYDLSGYRGKVSELTHDSVSPGFWRDCGSPIGTYTHNYNGNIISFELTSGVQARITPLGSIPQPPSIWTNLTTKPSIQDYEVSVVDTCKNQVVPNASVTLNYSAVPFSGGHAHHDANRRNGIFDLTAVNYTSEQSGTSPLAVNTGASGTAIVKYTAPQASGQTKVTMTCTLPDGATCESRDEFINVGVSGLLRMGAGGNYDIVDRPATQAVHPESHFVTPLLKQRLLDLADKYTAQFPGLHIGYNDMSLYQGGLLDYAVADDSSKAWKPPHTAHRLGENADIPFRHIVGDVVTPEGQNRLRDTRELILKACLNPEEHPTVNPNHFHVKPITCANNAQ